MTNDCLMIGAFCVQAILHRFSQTIRSKSVIRNDLGTVILVIDIGSSSIRCSPYSISPETGDVRLLHESTVKLSVSLHKINSNFSKTGTDENHASIQILSIVDKAVGDCIMSLRDHHERFTTIDSIGISQFAMNLLGIDDNGIPRTPLFTYATTKSNNGKKQNHEDDTGKEQRDYQYEMENHLSRTGTILNHQSYAIAQLQDFISQNPEAASTVTHWTTLASLFISRWTLPVEDRSHQFSSSLITPSVSASSSSKLTDKTCPVSYSEASWMGLLNFTAMKWDEKAISLSLIDPKTLPLLSNFTALNDRVLSPHYLSSYPELKNCKFYPGIGDGAAATVGSNCEGKRRISVTVGTSAAVRIIIKNSDIETVMKVPPPGLFCYRLDKDRLLIGGALTDGGSLLDWFSNLIGTVNYKKVVEEVTRNYLNSNYDSKSVTVLPFWSGERSIGWHDGASGTISGLTHDSSAASILLGIMEGLAFRISKIIHLMRDSGLIDSTDVACLVASGTALESSPVLRQMIANLSGYNLVCLKPDGRGEATSYGIVKMITDSTKCGEKGVSEILKSAGKNNRTSEEKNVILSTKESENNLTLHGFQESEILSITAPKYTMIDEEYAQKRAEENSALYNLTFAKMSAA